MITNVADATGVAKIVAHECFHRKHRVIPGISKQLRQSEPARFAPCGPGHGRHENAFRFAVAAKTPATFSTESNPLWTAPHFQQAINVGFKVLHKSQPANQVNIPQSAAGSLQIRP